MKLGRNIFPVACTTDTNKIDMLANMLNSNVKLQKITA